MFSSFQIVLTPERTTGLIWLHDPSATAAIWEATLRQEFTKRIRTFVDMTAVMVAFIFTSVRKSPLMMLNWILYIL